MNFEEQVRGWMTALAKATKVQEQIEKYRRLNRMLWVYAGLKVLDRNLQDFQQISGLQVEDWTK